MHPVNVLHKLDMYLVPVTEDFAVESSVLTYASERLDRFDFTSEPFATCRRFMVFNDMVAQLKSTEYKLRAQLLGL